LRLSEYKSQAELNNHSLACGQCWLLSDWYCIGCQNNKKYLPVTILSTIWEYCPVPNNPIPVSF